MAAASQALLDAGNVFCCLFTDLANPVSNAIYPRLGYRPVGDVAEIELDPPE
jgi:predicted GNAT family acetyltransferase